MKGRGMGEQGIGYRLPVKGDWGHGGRGRFEDDSVRAGGGELGAGSLRYRLGLSNPECKFCRVCTRSQFSANFSKYI